jgi:uncharacterized protein (DUF2236 family)
MATPITPAQQSLLAQSIRDYLALTQADRDRRLDAILDAERRFRAQLDCAIRNHRTSTSPRRAHRQEP